jgi:EAL and modified HD-GYP domain-containing signal transduction protein
LALLPSDKVVAEIPESVSADADVVRACKQLKSAGYRIALSNFRAHDPREALEDIADFLKIDIKMSSLADVARLTRHYRDRGSQLIAEKVETREDFAFTKGEGFSFFEGYFFRKPEMMRARGAQSNRTVFLRLLGAVSKPVLDWNELENIVKSDPTLYFRLLRYLNSAIFGLQGEVRTIVQKQAIGPGARGPGARALRGTDRHQSRLRKFRHVSSWAVVLDGCDPRDPDARCAGGTAD